MKPQGCPYPCEVTFRDPLVIVSKGSGNFHIRQVIAPDLPEMGLRGEYMTLQVVHGRSPDEAHDLCMEACRRHESRLIEEKLWEILEIAATYGKWWKH